MLYCRILMFKFDEHLVIKYLIEPISADSIERYKVVELGHIKLPVLIFALLFYLVL